MKVAICEDEKIFSDQLIKIIFGFFQQHGEQTDISVYSDGIPLEKACKTGTLFDIIFLDIQLEKSDGMEIASRIRTYDRKVAFIFVTGLEDRVFEGYAVSAFDYIVKSSINQRLSDVLERFLYQYRNSQLDIMTQEGNMIILPFSDVLWIESDGRGTIVGTEKCELYSVMPIGKISSKLPDEKFTEVYKSIYVQTQSIKCIKSDSVELCGGKVLPMSRRKRKSVMSAVMISMKGR